MVQPKPVAHTQTRKVISIGSVVRIVTVAVQVKLFSQMETYQYPSVVVKTTKRVAKMDA